LRRLRYHARSKLQRKRGLLSLNPVIKQQFLTLLYDVKRLHKIAEVPYTTPITIQYVYGSGKIENRAMYVESDHYLSYKLLSMLSQVLKLN